MTILKTDYASGNMFTAGDTTGVSGINDITNRINTHVHDGTDTPIIDLQANFGSGAIFTAGTQGGNVGGSGINDITGRINFGGFDFPQVSNTAYTSGASNEILTATVTGADTSYVQTITYNGDLSPIIVEISGTSIGSVVKYDFFYGTGSGTTSTGGLIAGSISIS